MDRMAMINMLLAAVDQANEAYIHSSIDADTWTKNLQEMDEKLRVLGLRLEFRPWEGNKIPGTGKGF
jgi:hypothetical protein